MNTSGSERSSSSPRTRYARRPPSVDSCIPTGSLRSTRQRISKKQATDESLGRTTPAVLPAAGALARRNAMKLGVYLPTMMPFGLTGRRAIEWARLADEAGFHVIATFDRPNYDSWDGLATLAGMATVTWGGRLSTLR